MEWLNEKKSISKMELMMLIMRPFLFTEHNSLLMVFKGSACAKGGIFETSYKFHENKQKEYCGTFLLR